MSEFIITEYHEIISLLDMLICKINSFGYDSGVYSNYFYPKVYKIYARKSWPELVDGPDLLELNSYGDSTFSIVNGVGQSIILDDHLRYIGAINERLHTILIKLENSYGKPMPSEVWDNYSIFSRGNYTLEEYTVMAANGEGYRLEKETSQL